jgi:hypothetical protein
MKLANTRTSHFKIFNVSTAFTPAMVIENVLAGKAEPKGWAITEVVEKGDGAWAKVSERIERLQHHLSPLLRL